MTRQRLGAGTSVGHQAPLRKLRARKASVQLPSYRPHRPEVEILSIDSTGPKCWLHHFVMWLDFPGGHTWSQWTGYCVICKLARTMSRQQMKEIHPMAEG